MATFSSWLLSQDPRADDTGRLARYWRDVTPGRISSPSGIRRTLEQIGDAESSRALGWLDAAWEEYKQVREDGAQVAVRDESEPPGSVVLISDQLGNGQDPPLPPEVRDKVAGLLRAGEFPDAAAELRAAGLLHEAEKIDAAWERVTAEAAALSDDERAEVLAGPVPDAAAGGQDVHRVSVYAVPPGPEDAAAFAGGTGQAGASRRPAAALPGWAPGWAVRLSERVDANWALLTRIETALQDLSGQLAASTGPATWHGMMPPVTVPPLPESDGFDWDAHGYAVLSALQRAYAASTRENDIDRYGWALDSLPAPWREEPAPQLPDDWAAEDRESAR